MVKLTRVVAELRYFQVEPNSYQLWKDGDDGMRLELNGQQVSRKLTGVQVLRVCAEATGRHDLAVQFPGRGYIYSAPPSLLDAAVIELGGDDPDETPVLGRSSQGGSQRRGRAAAAAAAGRTAAAVPLPTTPPRGATAAGAGPSSSAAAAAAGGGYGFRSAPAPVGVPDGAPDYDDDSADDDSYGDDYEDDDADGHDAGGYAADGYDADGHDADGYDADGYEEEEEEEELDAGYLQLEQRLNTTHGAALVEVHFEELKAWNGVKGQLRTVERRQAAKLAKARSNFKQYVTQDSSREAQQHMLGMMEALRRKYAQEIQQLQAADTAAAARVYLVQTRIDQDPAALLMQAYRGYGRWGVVRWVLLLLVPVVMGVVLQLTSPQCLEAVKAALANLLKKCWQCVCGLGAAVRWTLWAVAVVVKLLLVGALLSVRRVLVVIVTLGCWICRMTGRLICWLCKGSLRMFRRPQQGTAQQQQQQQASSMCLPAAANAAAMYSATEQMHNTVSGMRAYCAQHQQHQQQQRRWGRSIQQQQQQQLSQQPPTAADLSCVIVAVSRVVQMEYGALHGQGECSLRDQVLRLMTGLLSVEGVGVIASEQSMSGGRSDLVVTDLQGRSLLVVEYKQRHSAAASAHQQQDTAQLKRYLSDRRRRCDEGLLITFDKTLPNGLSATRVTRVTDRDAWAQLYNDRPSNAPVFMSQPLHHLESDPFAVGVMMGICQGYGIELTQDRD